MKQQSKKILKKLIRDHISLLLKNILFQIGLVINMSQHINASEVHAKNEYEDIKSKICFIDKEYHTELEILEFI